MKPVTEKLRKKLATHRLDPFGIQVPRVGQSLACWNLALTGTLITGSDPRAVNMILNGNGNNLAPSAILNMPLATCFGLADSATPQNHPGCEAELETLRDNFAGAERGYQLSQQNFFLALLRIFAIKNGLNPNATDNACSLHMVGSNWHTFDHFALSFRGMMRNSPRVYVQTTPDRSLTHACEDIFESDIGFAAEVNLTELHDAQIDLLECIKYGTVNRHCANCINMFPYIRSNGMAWRECSTCHANYCNFCAMGLQTKCSCYGYIFGLPKVKICNQFGCKGTTQEIVMN